MDVETLDALDNFINDASDQAAAWYSIVTQKPVTVPSATIQQQQTVANLVPTRATVDTPLGSYSIGGVDPSLVLIVGAVLVGYLLLRA